MKNLAIFVLVAAIVTAVTAISSLGPAALAAKSSGSNGLERADQNVHENTGPGSPQDIRFHEGTCQGGHATAALGPSGCNNPLITAPGNSDNHRQDK
jgi:hypothetical protein